MPAQGMIYVLLPLRWSETSQLDCVELVTSTCVSHIHVNVSNMWPGTSHSTIRLSTGCCPDLFCGLLRCELTCQIMLLLPEST